MPPALRCAEALRLDAMGLLVQAQVLGCQIQLSEHPEPGSLLHAFIVKSQVLRHQQHPATLITALDAARRAADLARLGGLEDCAEGQLARLELAACYLPLHRPTETLALTKPLLRVAQPESSGRAWELTGRAYSLLNQPFSAVAAVCNALGEYARQDVAHHRAQLALAGLFTTIGRVTDADTLLAGSLERWDGTAPVRRLSIHHRLLLAANHRIRGELSLALAALSQAEAWLDECTGMTHLKIRMLQLRAACLNDWGQSEAAHAATRQANQLTPKLGSQVPDPRHAPPVPALELRQPITLLDAQSGHPPHSPIGYWLTPADVPPQHPIHRAESAIRDALALPVSSARQLELLLDIVYAAQGFPGRQREEARLLLEAALALGRVRSDDLGPAADLAAQRLLRSCLVRLEWLPCSELLRGRAEIALGRVLARCGHDEVALKLITVGLETVDAQRFEMGDRTFRSNWLRCEVHPAIAVAIDLAARRDPALAADLIIFSRNSGVVVPQVTSTGAIRPSDVPLLPMPHLHYSNGEESALGSHGSCRYL